MTDIEDAPCVDCPRTVHLHDWPPCNCGDARCDEHPCPTCWPEENR